MSAWDEQIGGDHYKSLAIQPMEYSLANDLDAAQHTVIKYVTRFREKGGIRDLEKAKHTIDLLITWENRRKAVPTVAKTTPRTEYPIIGTPARCMVEPDGMHRWAVEGLTHRYCKSCGLAG